MATGNGNNLVFNTVLLSFPSFAFLPPGNALARGCGVPPRGLGCQVGQAGGGDGDPPRSGHGVGRVRGGSRAAPSQRTLLPRCMRRAWPAVRARLMAPSRAAAAAAADEASVESGPGGEQGMGGERRRVGAAAAAATVVARDAAGGAGRRRGGRGQARRRELAGGGGAPEADDRRWAFLAGVQGRAQLAGVHGGRGGRRRR